MKSKVGKSKESTHGRKTKLTDKDKVPANKLGASLVYVTLDSNDSAERLVKRLFSKGMIAQAEFDNGKWQRQFLMNGDLHRDVDKTFVQLTTSDERVTQLVNFLNDQEPN